jgi:hypothetical protein
MVPSGQLANGVVFEKLKRADLSQQAERRGAASTVPPLSYEPEFALT